MSSDPTDNIAGIDNTPIANEEKSFKQIFGSITSIEELTQRFVFYTPVIINWLTFDPSHLHLDIVSSLLRQTGGEDPLLINDLPGSIYYTAPYILKGPKEFTNQLYAVPTEIWSLTEKSLGQVFTIDAKANKACAFIPSKISIPVPFQTNRDILMDVVYFHGYSNKESWVFDTKTVIPELRWLPYIKDLKVYLDKLLQSSAETNNENQVLQTATEESERRQKAEFLRKAEQIQRDNKLHETLTRPLKYNQLTNEQKEHANNIIRRFRELFPDAPE
jgi:hypothetical protein